MARTTQTRSLLILGLAMAMHALTPVHGAAQVPTDVDPGQSEISRTQLEALLQGYEQAANSQSYSEAMRRQARRESMLLRQRLDEGDFQVGDQIALVVEGEEALSNTFTVQPGLSLALPQIGSVSLQGILRSELESHLQRELSRYIREPVVRARASIRVMITGGINRAGYHVFPTGLPLADALMAAGGPAPRAVFERMHIERRGSVIWEGEALQAAILEGRTLDQMSLQAGDQVVIPIENPVGRFEGVLRVAGLVAAPLALIATLLQAL